MIDKIKKMPKDEKIDMLSHLLDLSGFQATLLFEFMETVKKSGYGYVAINIKSHESFSVTSHIDGPPDSKVKS